jgi:hypothetical protein
MIKIVHLKVHSSNIPYNYALTVRTWEKCVLFSTTEQGRAYALLRVHHHEATIDFLINFRRGSSFFNYQGILNYL